jgi:hypothetical protein
MKLWPLFRGAQFLNGVIELEKERQYWTRFFEISTRESLTRGTISGRLPFGQTTDSVCPLVRT